jgi:hypothetical protein
MTFTAEVYRQWHSTYWVAAKQAEADTVDRFKETQTVLDNRDAARFVVLTADDSQDGLRQTAIRAENRVSEADTKLGEVMFTEKYRQKHYLDLVTIRELQELSFIMGNTTEDLVRGVRLEHDAVQEDAAALGKIADGTLPRRLADTIYTISTSLTGTDRAVEAFGGFEEEVIVSAPTEVEISRDRIDRALVDKWNEQTLKSLSEGSSTAFYQIDDLLIIDAAAPVGAQPYLEWAKQQGGMNPDATITIVKKGGAFDPGRIKAVGVKDRLSFEAAIKRISKKKVDY